jgi:hypothetical protein
MFDRASELSPSAPLFQMDAVMALANLARWDEADRRLAGIMPQWRGDPRLPAALATIGLARGDLNAVEQHLREGAQWKDLLAEEYFLTLLWKGDSGRAETFAGSAQESDKHSIFMQLSGMQRIQSWSPPCVAP